MHDVLTTGKGLRKRSIKIKNRQKLQSLLCMQKFILLKLQGHRVLFALAVRQEGTSGGVFGRAHPARKRTATLSFVVLSVSFQTKALVALAAREPLLFVRADIVLGSGKSAMNK